MLIKRTKIRIISEMLSEVADEVLHNYGDVMMRCRVFDADKVL